MSDLNLSRIASIAGALGRLPEGQPAYELAKRLGLVTAAHQHPDGRKPFPAKFSTMSDDQLSDAHSWWLSEYGRITELVGALSGQKDLIDTRLKSAQARARSRARSEVPDGDRTPPKNVLDDVADADPAVQDLTEQLAYVKLLLAHATAARTATQTYLSGIDKEIILRTSHMKAGVRG